MPLTHFIWPLHEHLHLPVFVRLSVPVQNVPTASLAHGSDFTDNLGYLLPRLHFRALSRGGRVLLVASAGTAAGCLGLVAPLSYMLTAQPEAVVAWSVATAAGAGLTTAAVWSTYWRAQSKVASWLRDMVSLCDGAAAASWVLSRTRPSVCGGWRGDHGVRSLVCLLTGSCLWMLLI